VDLNHFYPTELHCGFVAAKQQNNRIHRREICGLLACYRSDLYHRSESNCCALSICVFHIHLAETTDRCWVAVANVCKLLEKQRDLYLHLNFMPQ
jgi:hypothetical protein